MKAKGDLDGAMAEYRRAIALDRNLAQAHAALARALLAQGRFADARAAIRRCLELLPEGHQLRKHGLQQLRQCERLLALDKKLPAILEGKEKPADVAERLALAQLCQVSKERYALAARFYADAFDAEPQLPNDLRNGLRYNAACAAALAGCGRGQDGAKLEEKERTRLRHQALDWLRADLALWTKVADNDNPKARAAVQQPLKHWQADADLAGLRDGAALAKLPEAERQTWHQLWDNLAVLLEQARGPEKSSETRSEAKEVAPKKP